MRKRLFKALSAIAAVVVLVSAGCTDTTVEPKSTITDANIFNDQNSYKAFIAKLYAGMAVTGQRGPDGQSDIRTGDEGFSHYLRLLWQLQELPTDEAILAWGDLGVDELNHMKWGETNPFVTQMYYRIFYQVVLANEFLRQTTDDRLAARGTTDAIKTAVKQYRAEARFLRALSYWHGLDIFGNIPLVTEASPIGAAPPAQNTRTELFDFVVSELNAIKADLPTAGLSSSYGRGTTAAANMVLAKLYMNSQVYTGTARYAEARAAVEAVIGAGYTLASNNRLNFSANNNSSPELIFVVVQDGARTKTWGGMTFLIHASCGESMSDSDQGISGCWWGLRTRAQAYQQFSAGDNRASVFVINGPITFANDVNSWKDFKQGVAVTKFTNRTTLGAAGSDGTHPDTDYPMFRLADAYLMYAEAVVRNAGGSRTTALGYINALRARANVPAITDAQMTLDFILAERGRELLWEGHRRQDLIRFGRFSGNTYIWDWKGGVPAGQATAAHLEIYPIPQNDLVANPNLSQNPGY